MGVDGFWPIVSSKGKLVSLNILSDKVLAIDASIWIYQFANALKDGDGEPIRGSHIVGFFKRICKLLFLRVKPIFVFDGPPIPLKFAALRKRQEDAISDAMYRKAAGQLLRENLLLLNAGKAVDRLQLPAPPASSSSIDEVIVMSDDSSDDLSPSRRLRLSVPDEFRGFISERRTLDCVNLPVSPEKSEQFPQESKFHTLDVNIDIDTLKDLPLHEQYRGLLQARTALLSQGRRKALHVASSLHSGNLDLETLSLNQVDAFVQLSKVTDMCKSVRMQMIREANKEEDHVYIPDPQLATLPARKKRKATFNAENLLDSCMSSAPTQSRNELLFGQLKKEEIEEYKSEVEEYKVIPNLPLFGDDWNDVLGPKTSESSYNVSDFSQQRSDTAGDPTENDLAKPLLDERSTDAQASFESTLLIEMSTDSQLLKGESTDSRSLDGVFADPHVLKGESTDSVLLKGESADPILLKGESTDPILLKEDSSDPIFQKGESTDPILQKGESTDPVFLKKDSSDPIFLKDDSSDPILLNRVSPVSLLIPPATTSPATDPSWIGTAKLVTTLPVTDPSLIASARLDAASATTDPSLIAATNPPTSGPVYPADPLLDSLLEQFSEPVVNMDPPPLLSRDDLGQTYTEIQELLYAFGIPWVSAPSDAEAQCAYLCSVGLADAVVSDDSDTLIFGSSAPTVVFRKLFGNESVVEMFKSTTLGFPDPEQLISLALLLGCDFTEGVRGIGPVNATEIVRHYSGMEGLARFRKWAESNEDREDSFHSLHSKIRHQWVFPTDFPSQQVWDVFAHPNVDRSTDPFGWETVDEAAVVRIVTQNTDMSLTNTQATLNTTLTNYKQATLQRRITDYFSPAFDRGQIAQVVSKRLNSALNS